MGLGFYETFSYAYKNPIICGATDYVKYAAGFVMPQVQKKAVQPASNICSTSIYRYTSSNLVRVAGICGASAVILGAIGAHMNQDASDEQKKLFETGNGYHFIHTVALLGAPMCRWPKTCGALLSLGMVFFCGPCYYHAFTGDDTFSQLTPWGGTLLIAGWISMAL